MDCPEGHLKDPDDSRKDEPHPVLWGVDDKEYKVGPVEVVSVPEDLEVAPPSDEWERADNMMVRIVLSATPVGLAVPGIRPKMFGFVLKIHWAMVHGWAPMELLQA